MAMIERTRAARAKPIAYMRIRALPVVVVGICYLASYVLLDWISYIEPYASANITPWDPCTGLSFALVLLFGARMIPLLFIGPVLGDLVLPLPEVSWVVELSFAALIGGGYSTALAFLLHPSTRFNSRLSSMRDLVLLMLVAGVSSAFVSSSYVAVAIFAGLLTTGDFAAATIRYGIGDLIGILVVTPFALIAFSRIHVLRISLETVLQSALVVGALALIFGSSEEQRFQLFYVLFLPIIWTAVRTGFEGVCINILITQVGLILGVTLFPARVHDVTAIQTLMLVLAATGLVAGELVAGHRRIESRLRLHQELLSRVAQLGGMGELTTAIAHELNQPLMAARTYARLVDDAICRGNADLAMVGITAKKTVAQVERAAEVVRSLRALVRLDSSNRASHNVEHILRETLALCRVELDNINASARAVTVSDLPPVFVDLLQVEQALLNLLRNSIEALDEAKISEGHISVEASAAGTDFVEIRVTDNGPGFLPDQFESPFLPFLSTKAEGLGYGLSLCKSIIEAHGGRLWLDENSQGADIHFTLPVAKAS